MAAALGCPRACCHGALTDSVDGRRAWQLWEPKWGANSHSHRQTLADILGIPTRSEGNYLVSWIFDSLQKSPE